MKALKIFEPAMCCPTGLCGVGVDPELLRISATLETLGKLGISVDRFNLSNAPMEFVSNATVNNFINDKGTEALPITLLEGKIVLEGAYPTNEELSTWLDFDIALLADQAEAAQAPTGNAGCGCSEGGCC